jgi:hypothetical protein
MLVDPEILRAFGGQVETASTANEADGIDRGELYVNDQWVVLIKPAAMSAEKVVQLMRTEEFEPE